MRPEATCFQFPESCDRDHSLYLEKPTKRFALSLPYWNSNGICLFRRAVDLAPHQDHLRLRAIVRLRSFGIF
jgi:hypothetical protein